MADLKRIRAALLAEEARLLDARERVTPRAKRALDDAARRLRALASSLEDQVGAEGEPGNESFVIDMTEPTPALRAAVTDALFADSLRTPEQQLLLDAYFAVTCGDCETGRCHWGGQASKDSTAAAAAGREYHQQCGCDRHAVSVCWRKPAGQEPAP